jgi:hypothetical protein
MCATVVGLVLASMTAACDGHDRAAGDIPSGTASDARVSPVPLDSARAVTDTAGRAMLEPGALHGVMAAPVSGWTGAGGRPFEVTLRTADPASANARRFGTITLRTSLRARSADLGQYPCTSCHLGRAVTMADNRVADAHQNIRPQHPVQTGGACSTCHAPADVELLALKSGDRATLDHAYRLCAQCHFAQAEAWAGGAHGKRLDGWQGRRVVMGCADCHDPHKPGVEKRIPFRAPQVERRVGHEP